MTEKQLDELERLDKEATKGRYMVDLDKRVDGAHQIVYVDPASNRVYTLAFMATGTDDNHLADAELIASLRNACPGLISLARIGLAAVEEDQGGGLTAFGQTQARIDAYLARKDG